MSIDSMIADAGQQCAVEVDSTFSLPSQTAMGGADRTATNWVTVADAVPCLVRILTYKLEDDQNGQRVAVVSARIYFVSDPVPDGLNVRHRVRITNTGTGGPRVTGTWSVQGVNDPNSMGRLIYVDAQRTGTA